MLSKIHHVGIVVKSADETRPRGAGWTSSTRRHGRGWRG